MRKPPVQQTVGDAHVNLPLKVLTFTTTSSPFIFSHAQGHTEDQWRTQMHQQSEFASGCKQ